MADLSAVEVTVKLEDGLEETGFQLESVNERDDATGAVKLEDDKKVLLAPHESQLGVEVRPLKRRRILVPSVVVPTLALAHAKQEDYKKLKKLKNPKVKKKKGVVQLSQDSIRARLNPIGLDIFPIPLPWTTANVGVSREFISKYYGGSPQCTFPRIGKKFIDLHGDIEYMYLNLDYNPHAPQVPGAPGLFYGWEGDGTEIFRLIVCIGRNEWTYVGEYKTGPCAPLTVEEWNSQDRVVKMTWAQGIIESSWGVASRATIRLRERLGRKATEEEIDDAIDAGEKFQDVTIEEVLAEFSSGRKSLHMSTLKCVDYDAGFQQFLVDNYPSFVPTVRTKRGSKKNAETGQAIPSRVKKSSNGKNKEGVETGGKRKRGNRRRAQDEEEDEEEEEIEELAYRPRGTRTWPQGSHLN
ncbi:hypothetical protein EV421DRAFT_1936332 [Armillaria borealis]|uniref:DUF6697 domain-containing protein n=1 Tax=Armillaria borealis TaxID=47425 RepID=A0AA39JNC6_9AGAR|nr:hypothetical protein EV421DRAFT_1936332 [Armillaria borealis]